MNTETPDIADAPQVADATEAQPEPVGPANFEKALAIVASAKNADPNLNAAELFAELTPAELAKLNVRIADWKRETKSPLNLRELSRVIKSATQARRKADRSKKDASKKLPEVMTTGRHIRDIAADSLRRLVESNDPPVIYVRGGDLTQIVIDEKGRCTPRPMSESGLRGQMDRVANFVSIEMGGIVADDPPLKVVKDILALNINAELCAMNLATFPALEGVIGSPVIRADGTILAEPGYDPATRLYYAPPPGLGAIDVPHSPIAEQVREAVKLIREMIDNFPFANDPSIANCIGAIVTNAARPAFGKVPICLFDKPQPGTGASLLAEAIAKLNLGGDVQMYGAPAEGDEWRKLLTSILMTAAPIAIIDNVETKLEDDGLARCVTATEWADRLLGQNREVRYPIKTVFYVTGNNIQLGRNLARRCYQIYLNAQLAQPWKRDANQFKHPNLIEWVSNERARLLSAVLTICRAWYASGKPQADTPILGSFEEWSKVVGGILAHAGIKGFLGNLDTMTEGADEESLEWAAFLLAWQVEFDDTERTASEVESRIKTSADFRQSLPGELARLVALRPAGAFSAEAVIVDAKFKQRLGFALRKRVAMRFDGNLSIERGANTPHGKVATWRVIQAPDKQTAGNFSKSAGNSAGNFTPGGDDDHKGQAGNGDLRGTAGNWGNFSIPIRITAHDTHARTHTRESSNRGKQSPQSPHSPQPPVEAFDPDIDAYEAAERAAIQSEGVQA